MVTSSERVNWAWKTNSAIQFQISYSEGGTLENPPKAAFPQKKKKILATIMYIDIVFFSPIMYMLQKCYM